MSFKLMDGTEFKCSIFAFAVGVESSTVTPRECWYTATPHVSCHCHTTGHESLSTHLPGLLQGM